MIYYLLHNHRAAQNTVLCLFSLLFYAWGEPKFVLIMILSIFLNWFFALLIENNKANKIVSHIIISADLFVNLGIIFIFKYLVFTIKNINALLFTNITVPNITLPIGISFFTFQAISYVIDVYRGHGKAQKNIINVALYISLFPQLIAGPIVRYETIENQIYNRNETFEDFSSGVSRFIIGLGKKIIIANNMALVADAAFNMSKNGVDWFGVSMNFSSEMAWIGAIAYTFQIYFDFSGYSDMAIGLGKMFGFHFLENFNYPYISKSITEFWRRWHISLGSWFRDYLYIPLGGSRCTNLKNNLNLIIVWICTGIWHGANWTFILWGIMYCLLLMFERATKFNRNKNSKLINCFSWIYTIFFVIIGWVIFRADNLDIAYSYIKTLFTPSFGFDKVALFYIREYGFYFLLALIASTPYIPAISKAISRRSSIINIFVSILEVLLLIIIFIVSISFIIKGSYNPFIYFNF